MDGMILQAPTPLTPEHHTGNFTSGEAVLDEWLKRRAQTNQRVGASKTYVVVDQKHGRVRGYYALASGSIRCAEVAGSFRRNMPDPIPVVILGRLAVDLSAQGRGIGTSLLRDAMK